MDFKAFIIFFIAINLQSLVESQYGSCDYDASISVGGSVVINHLMTTGTCRYKIFSPVDTFMQADCTTTLQGSCATQNLTVSRSGEKGLYDGLSYCTSTTFSSRSVGNELVLAFKTSTSNVGSFRCTITAIAPDNSNCDCSWNVNSKIVGGTGSGMNEFTPLAGIIDRTLPTIDPYCGGVVSKFPMS